MGENKLLGFHLKRFCRTTWASDEAKKHWAPRFERYNAKSSTLQLIRVAEGITPAVILSCQPFQVFEFLKSCRGHHLSLRVLGDACPHALRKAGLQVDHTDCRVYVAIARESILDDVCEVAEHGEPPDVWKVLGWPECCGRFFYENVHKQGLRDPVWPVACHGVETNESSIEVAEKSWLNSGLFRRLGIQINNFTPCSFSCANSANRARTILEIMRQLGFLEEVDLLEGILQSPADWSTLHGIAELKCPILKFAYDTDAVSSKRSILFLGSRIPEFSSPGVRFPFPLPSFYKIRDSNSFKRGLSVIQTSSE